MLPYPEMTGGVLSIRAAHYEALNGFSNLFRGWGGEDDDFYRRIVEAGLELERSRGSRGR